MSSDSNANASSGGATAASPIQGGSSAPLSLEAILLQARSVAAKRATPSAQGQQATPTSASASADAAAADAAPTSPLAAAASDSPTYASAADSKADAAAHNVGEKGTLKGGRASLMASAAPGTGASDSQTPRPSAGKRVPKNKSDDRNRSRTEMAVDNAIASDPNLSDDLSLHIVELKFFYQMSLVQVVAGVLTAVLSIYVASTGNSRAAGLIVTGLLATLTAVFARTAGTSILGRELSDGQKAMLAKLQLNTYELLFAYMYSSVILAVLSLSFALGELSLNDNLLGVAGLFLFCVLCIGTMLAVRSLSLKIVLHYSFQFLNLLFLLFGYAIIFLAGWAYKKNILSRYTANANAWFAASIVVGVSTVLISFWGILASRRRSKRWLLSYAVVLSVLLAGVLAAAIGVYTNDSIVDAAVNQNCANILGDMADTSVQDELGCVKYAAVGDSAADTCPIGFATTVWETTAATQAADADTIRFGCINQQCCTAIKEYIHSNGRYLYLMALLGLVFGIAAVVAALYQRQMLRAGIKSDSMPNQEFYIMLAMTVLTVVCIVATPVAISTVSVPKLVPATVDNNAALTVASDVTLSGCGLIAQPALLYPANLISQCSQASGGCYLSVTIESQAADVQFPPYSDLHSIAVQPLDANGVTQRIEVTGLASEINTLFDSTGVYGLFFCPFCLTPANSNSTAQYLLTLTYAGLNGAPAPAYGPWSDTVRITTTAQQSIVGVVKDGNTQVDTPLQGVGVSYEMYGQSCEQIGGAVTTAADGRYTLAVPIPSLPGNGLAATVIFKHPNPLYAEERTLVTIGGPSSGQAALVPAVVMYPAPAADVNEQLCASNNGGCDMLTQCVPMSMTARYCTHCPTGYEGNADVQAGGSGCQDIDECTAYPNGNCDAMTVCTNLPGSYNCSDCSIGANGRPTGYYGNGKTGCIDINECATNNGGFSANFTCINTPGSWQVGPCIFGYTTTYDPITGAIAGCENVNECQAANGPCAPGVACSDAAPSANNSFVRFTCGPCPEGYSGDGLTCSPVDPCALNNGGCSQNPKVSCTVVNSVVQCGAEQPGSNKCPHDTSPWDSSIDIGFYGDGKTCTDVNECVVVPDLCPLLYSLDGCVNDFGSYICYDTSAGDAPAPGCETLDSGNGGCDRMTTCTAQPTGDPLCGYCPSQPTPRVYRNTSTILDTIQRPYLHTRGDAGRANGVSGQCTDVDECQYNPCDPLAICVNKSPLNVGTATAPGSFGTYDGFTCACGPGTTEYINFGGFATNVPNAYRYPVLQNGVSTPTSCTPIPVCATTCDPLVTCTIVNSQAVCGQCPTGYVGSGSVAGGGCHAFNSCVVNNGGCSSLTTCNSATTPNTCNPCPTGFTSTDGAKTCVDINECLTNNGQCDSHTVCINTAGSRTCTACPPGYAGNGDLTIDSYGCVDVNECSVANGGCDPLSTCVNTPGGFTCGTCPAGYGGSGYTGCHMINLCAQDSPCSPHTTCVMLPGPPATFECGACDPNCFRADSPRRNIGNYSGCVPLPLCDTNNGGCPVGALCTLDLATNSSCPGVQCNSCPHGYLGTPPNCVDDDECAVGHAPVCSANAICQNNIGSFTCTCNQYYGGNAYQIAPAGCQPIDYCDSQHNPCYANTQLSIAATCTNVPPAQCGPCPTLNGVKILVGDGITCTDYDECTDPTLVNGDCDPNGLCFNQLLAPRTCSACLSCQTGTGTGEHPCMDKNECATNNGGCDRYVNCTNQVCDATHDGFSCGPCPPGYAGTGYTQCTPRDMCDPNPCGAFSTCQSVEIPGVSVTAQCGCIAEYERLPGATDCTPIQKCAADYVLPGCDPATQVCSFCDPLTNCSQPIGSPFAVCTTCGAGFIAGTPGTMSTGGCAPFNIDECALNTDNCDPSVTCSDRVPSLANGRQQFYCSDCQPPGYEPGPGYGSCTSHNFCGDPTLVNGGCDVHATCQNTRGSRNCTCNTAQGWVGNGLTCIADPTLCDVAHNPCDDLVSCSAGSPDPAPAVCGPCPAHYTGSGYLSQGGCKLADECGQPNNGNCTCGTTCTMHPTGRTCDYDGVQNQCPPGFQGDGSFGGCAVIDLCTPNPCGVGACLMSTGDSCTHVAPQPYCMCPPGYEGNVTTGCHDCDECTKFANLNGLCSDHSQCVNTPGSRLCVGCNPGYCGNPYSRGNDSCANIDECAGQTCGGNGDPCVCSPHATCTDLSPVNVGDPGFTCSACAAGWQSNRVDGTGTGCYSCDNINECATNNGGCSVQPPRACTDDIPMNPGDPLYTCAPCGTGWNETYEANPYGGVVQVCTDINECQLPVPVCDPLTTCANSQGSYSCGPCPCGMTSDSGDGKTACRDINECALPVPASQCPATYPFCFTSANVPNAVAVVSSICINGVLPTDSFPFRCGPCPTGYGPTGPVDDGINCVNINECATDNGGCADHQNCVDTVGSRNCVCATGYEPAPAGGCQEINPCDHQYCAVGGDAPSTCVHTGPNNATCSCPAVGFDGTGYASSPCTNINECATNNGGCDSHATCTDLIPATVSDPTHECGACPAGYDGDGSVAGGCTPHNRCTDPSLVNGGCDPLTVCTQTGPNTRSCSDCPSSAAAPNTTQVPYYTKRDNGDGTETCVDINECLTNNGGCWNGYNGAQGGVAAPAVTCTNYAPTPTNHLPPYQCGSCPTGWIGDPTNCQNLNECLTNNGGCPANSNCADTIGSRDCVCIDGFRMVGGVCQNINECQETPSVCSLTPPVTCTDLTPSSDNGWQKYQCGPCPTGYSGTGATCDNVNECASNNGGCSIVGNSVCTDTIGNFTCGNCDQTLGYQPKPGYTPCEPILWCASGNGGCDPVVTCTQTGVGPNSTAAGVVCGTCPAPYFQQVAGNGACPDVNECATNNGGCPTNPLVLCHNERGAPQWCDRCPPGFVNNTASGSLTCDDINECATTNGGCEQVCTNTPGSRRCSCNDGYTLNADTTTCADVNECATSNGGCSSLASCANTIGSRTCTCWVGTQGTGVDCGNINECLYNNGNCTTKNSAPYATCTDATPTTPANGPFRTCTCPSGTTGTGVGDNGCIVTDVNECATNNGGCDQNAQCTRVGNSHTCACHPGYTGSGQAGTCMDVNECATNNGGCSRYCTPAVQCFNLAGSFYCGVCPSGYTGDGYTCVDINECATGNGGCYDTCTNTVGSYSCNACPAGTTGNGKTCTDINECKTNNGGCFAGVACTNLVPSKSNGYQTRSCGGCPSGYSGAGVVFPPQTTAQTCADVNECAVSNGGCFAGVQCTNTVGSRICGSCPAGYTGDGVNCVDINECKTNNGGCSVSCRPQVQCTNYPGGFSCGSCPDGYQGNPYDPNGCTDINECKLNNGGCGQYRACTNTDGSWDCGPCPAGTIASGSNCIDVNECATANGGCYSAAGMKCFNTFGSFFCAYQPSGTCPNGNCPSTYNSQIVSCPSGKCQACPPGYWGDGQTCTDINECATSNGGCPIASVCTNTGGSRSCACPTGYTLIGNACTNINECATNNGGCDPATTCYDNNGGRTCSNCPAGYVSGNGANGCIDLNECATNNGGCSTDPLVRCTNTRGSRTCAACPSGYTGDGRSCVDINECACNNGGCRGTCTNSPGSYECSPCPGPWWWPSPDRFHCALVNECATNNGGCDPRAQCYDTGLSIIGLIIPYYCGPCPSGFTGSGYLSGGGCVDINECKTNNGGCFARGSDKATCTNTVGSRTCGACPAGYDGDGINCIARNTQSAITVKVVSATTGLPIPSAIVRLRANTLQGRCMPWDDADAINGLAGRTYLDRDDYPHGSPAYTLTTDNNGVVTFNGIQSGGWSIESNGAQQPRLVCLLGCSPFDWCHTRCLWCDAAPTGYSHGFKYITSDGLTARTYLLALSPTDLYLGQVRIVLSWDTTNNLNMHLTYATSTQQCDVSTVLAGTNCATTDIVREQRDAVDGTMGVETYKIAVPRTTTYEVSVQNASPVNTYPSIYDTGATVSLYIGWGWWGSSWPYIMLPVAGADPAGQDASRTKTYWAVYCAREYSWSGFAPLNSYSTTLDWSYSRKGQTNTCPILRR